MRFQATGLVVLVFAAGVVSALALVRRQPPAERIVVASHLRQLASVGGAGASSSRATTGPSDPGAMLPSEYAFLTTRNPFAHGAGGGAAGGGGGGAEAALVFHGVAEAGTSFTAFVEDMAAKHVLQLAAGDAVGRGRIRSIDIDSLQYEVAGKAKRIEIGQNLNGEAAPVPPPASQPAPPPPPEGAPGAEPGGPPAGLPGGHHRHGGPGPVPENPQ